jgi:hypothetical protein
LPAAVRERYCLRPACLPGHLFPYPPTLAEILDGFRTAVRAPREGQPHLFLGYDGGDGEWFATLDGSDDPPVTNLQRWGGPPDSFDCGPFSALVFFQCWAALHREYLTDDRERTLQASDPDIGPMELDYLRDHFQEGPTPGGWWVFFGDGAWIQVHPGSQPRFPQTLYLFARSARRLREVLRILWPVASLRETLKPAGSIARSALEAVRRSFEG